MFPFTFRRSSRFLISKHTAEQPIEYITGAIVERLMKHKPGSLSYTSNQIKFTGGILFRPGLVTGWNLLLPFSSGEILIESNGENLIISYKLKFTELFVILTIAFLVLPLMFQNGGSTIPPIFILGWLWLFGCNYLTGVIRFSRFLSSVLKEMQ